jgi:taurine dioxygenase
VRRRALDPVGVELTDVTLAQLGPDATDELVDLLAQHGVLVVPDQRLDDVEFARFLGLFGELMFTTGETPVPGHPDLNVISNVGRAVPPRSTFHVDTSYVRRPPGYTALRAVQIPSRGGETLFSDQYRAYDTLPPDLAARVDGRSITHVVTGLDLGPDDETEAEHPIVRRHPVSGRRSLYLTTPARCRGVSGLDAAESARLVHELFEHSTRSDNVLRHSWSSGDVVMWDNGCVLHRADHADVVGDRVMHRGMVAARADVS